MTGYICCTCGEGSLSAPLPRWCPACGTYNDPAEEAADIGDGLALLRKQPRPTPEDSHANRVQLTPYQRHICARTIGRATDTPWQWWRPFPDHRLAQVYLSIPGIYDLPLPIP